MRSNRRLRRAYLFSAVSLGAILALPSCGLLGGKKDRDTTITFGGNTSCLNDLGSTLDGFMQGTVLEADLVKTWDCTIKAHETFRDFVKGNATDGAYAVDDLHSFVNRVLVTNKKISKALVKRTFEFKASLFGRSDKELSKNDLNTIITLLHVMKAESLKLLPLIREFRRDSNALNTERLAFALSDTAEKIVSALSVEGRLNFSEEAAQTMALEINFNFGFHIKEEWISRVFKANGALMNHDTRYIRPGDWGRLIRLAAPAGAFAMAASIGGWERIHTDDEYLRLLLKLSGIARHALQRSFVENESGMSLRRLRELIDVFPENWLPVKNRAVFHSALTRAVQKLLHGRVSGDDIQFDENSVELAYDLFSKFVDGRETIHKIFDYRSLDPATVLTKDFIDAAHLYEETIKDPAEKLQVNRLIALAIQHRPHFRGNNSEMTFAPNVPNSRHNLETVHWTTVVAEHLMDSYSKDAAKATATVDDIREIFNDYKELAWDMEAVDRTLPRWEERRFREADLFVYSANGDGLIDVAETSDLMMFLISISNGTSRLKEVVENTCKGTSLATDVIDPLGWLWMDPQCFRKQYYSNFQILWKPSPILVSYYQRLDSGVKADFQKFADVGARRCMKNLDGNPVGGQDASSYIGAMHYMEGLFMRFDRDMNGRFSTKETTEYAFPAFRNFLAQEADMKPSDPKLKSLFAWIVKKGYAPKTIADKLAFLAWHTAGSGQWDINADRYALYRIISQFAVPEAADTYNKYCH